MAPSTGGEPTRIFVSHSSEDNEFGVKLVEDLRRELGGETAVWYDAAGGLRGGDAWWRKIVEEITTRPIFVVVLSPDAVKSQWVNDEIDLAWKQKNSLAGKRIVPVLYRACAVREDLTTRQIISFQAPKHYDTALAELLAAIAPKQAEVSAAPPSRAADHEAPPQRQASLPPAAAPARPRAWWVVPGSLLAIVAVLALIAYFSSQYKGQTSNTGSPPAGATDAKIFAAADAAMQACATVSLQSPPDCPQSLPGSPATSITWLLHGDPASGAAVRWLGNGNFTVNGAYVFTVSYIDILGNTGYQVISGFYAATEHWNGTRLTVTNLSSATTGPRVPRPVQATGPAAISAARSYFDGHRSCGSGAPCVFMPPFKGSETQNPTSIVYGSSGAQFIPSNATVRFDSATGIIHVGGNYATHVTAEVSFLGPVAYDIAGTYDFLLIVDSGKLIVISVAYTNVALGS